jgi:hypothetical protein
MRTGTYGYIGGWTDYPPTQALAEFGRERWPVEVCNSTADTAATSRWLPIRHQLHPTPEHTDVCAASGNFNPVGWCDCTDADRLDEVLMWFVGFAGLTSPTS